ncbi:MAG TPA: hypothetical protein VF933_14455, partial [Streptosporangiaceae bacterium]
MVPGWPNVAAMMSVLREPAWRHAARTLAIGTGRVAPGPGTRPTPLMSAADSPYAGQATAPSRWLRRITGAG